MKIASSEKISCSLNSSYSYSCEDGKIYIDTIIDFTNKTKSEIEYEEAVKLTVTKDDGTIYSSPSFFGETSNGTSIDSYDEITPYWWCC